MPDSSTDLLSYDELIGLFGDTLPAEAIDIVFNSPDGMLVSEVRAKLNKFAQSRRSPSPAGVTEAAVEAAADALARAFTPGGEDVPYEAAARAALLAAIPLLSPSMGWETIDTAPRDGTAVLLYAGAWSMSWGEVQTGHFEGDGEGGGTWVTGEGSVDDNEADFDPDAEVDEDGGDAGFDADVNIGPTHWQRLPLPPANGEGR